MNDRESARYLEIDMANLNAPASALVCPHCECRKCSEKFWA